MRSAIFATLVLLAGCGGYHSRPVVTDYPQPPVQPGPTPGISAFVVDANVGVVADPDTYGITTDGTVWRLTWLGDAYERHFQGTITCPAGCQFTYARFENAYPGDTVVVNGNQVSFDAVTNAAVPQTLDLASPLQPLTYDLFIDGQEAIGAVIFQSYGVRSTTDTMPFALYSSNSGFKTEGKTQTAPQFISLLPKDSKQTTMVLPPGQGSSGASSAAVKQ